MHGHPDIPYPSIVSGESAAKTQADRLVATRRTLTQIGTDIAAAARLAAATHMAASAPNAQITRDQATRLRELVASMAIGAGVDR